MLKALALFLSGIISGIFSSIPIGPTNFWIANAVMPPAKPTSSIIAFVIGIMIMDVAYALTAFWGTHFFFEGDILNSWLGLTTGILLIGMGGLEWKSIQYPSPVKVQTKTTQAAGIAGHGFLGILFGVNPGFILYWIAFTSLLTNWGIGTTGQTFVILISLGIVVGDIIWYWGFAATVMKGAKRLSEERLKILRFIIIAILILFGLYLIHAFFQPAPAASLSILGAL